MSFTGTLMAVQPLYQIILARDLARPLIREILREIELTPDQFQEELEQM